MSRGRVLIVEDNKDIREDYEERIRKGDFIVDTADTRLEAFEKIRCRTYHVALIDIMLTSDPNDRGGFEVLKYLRSLAEGTRSIVVSGTSDIRVPVDVMKEGTYTYLIKKYNRPSDVLPKVEEEFSKCKLNLFGKFDTFTAYLAGPGNAPYYEDVLMRLLNVGAKEMSKFMSIVFDPILPALSKINSAGGLDMDTENRAVYGLLWSKSYGHAVWISAGPLDSKFIEPNLDRPIEIILEQNKGPWKWKVWKVQAKRDDFAEKLYDV